MQKLLQNNGVLSYRIMIAIFKFRVNDLHPSMGKQIEFNSAKVKDFFAFQQEEVQVIFQYKSLKAGDDLDGTKIKVGLKLSPARSDYKIYQNSDGSLGLKEFFIEKLKLNVEKNIDDYFALKKVSEKLYTLYYIPRGEQFYRFYASCVLNSDYVLEDKGEEDYEVRSAENLLFDSNDAREFVWNCVKEFQKEGILKDLFHSDYASKGGNQRDYWVINGCFCSYIIADPSYADEPLEFEGKWICDGFRVDGGTEDVKKFGDAINDVFDGRYKVLIEGDTFKLLKIVTLDEPRQQIFFGAPGTGKSFRVEQITKIYGEDVIRTTFHPDSDYSTFVGCYKPTMKEAEVARVNQPILDYDSLVDKFKEYLNVPNANITKACSLFGYNYHDSIVRMQEQGRRVMDLVNDAYKSNTTYDSVVRGGMACYEEGGAISQSKEAEIVYSFVPQAFTQAYTRAWKNQGRPIFLVIEELNRGNCAQIFGDIFQLLDRNEKNVSSYSIIPDRDLQQHFADEFKDVEDIPADIKSGKSMRLPANLYIWATMNTSDQSLFPIDSAFKRRWIWKYIPIANAEKGYTIEVGAKSYDWWTFVDKVNNEIEGATKSEDKKLGYFFAKADGGIISADTFVSKVVFYLWNDVFKDSYDKTIFKNGLTFHRFFEPNGDPKIEVVDQFLQDLGLKAIGEE